MKQCILVFRNALILFSIIGQTVSTAEDVKFDNENELETPDHSNANNSYFEESFSFYVMGDTPYTEQEAKLLSEQISNLDEDALFMIHVGDLMKSSTCAIDNYRDSSRILQGSPVPVLVLPGDNDWIDCPNPNLALRRFRRYFISRQYDNLYFTEFYRQKQRIENFFFEFDGVLFFGLNVSVINYFFTCLLIFKHISVQPQIAVQVAWGEK